MFMLQCSGLSKAEKVSVACRAWFWPGWEPSAAWNRVGCPWQGMSLVCSQIRAGELWWSLPSTPGHPRACRRPSRDTAAGASALSPSCPAVSPQGLGSSVLTCGPCAAAESSTVHEASLQELKSSQCYRSACPWTAFFKLWLPLTSLHNSCVYFFLMLFEEELVPERQCQVIIQTLYMCIGSPPPPLCRYWSVRINNHLWTTRVTNHPKHLFRIAAIADVGSSVPVTREQRAHVTP